MQAAEYFDSIAQFWDMEYSDNELAREITAAISVPRGGGYVLDIGCGSGGMILDLMRHGACEIEGIDFSNAMAEMARDKFSFDPRVRIETMDFALLGTSMPMADLPGMGASILTLSAARRRAISSARDVILLILTPASGTSSYLVTEGPLLILVTVAFILKLSRVAISLLAPLIISS